MLSKVYSFGVNGVDGYTVTVETYLSGGLPGFEIVGLPDNAVKESKERVRSAIKNNKYDYPSSRITVNLAPADIKKSGAVYDLPILLSILSAGRQIPMLNPQYAFAAQLALNGDLRGINGILSMAISAKQNGFTDFFVASENANEAATVEGLNIYAIDDISQLISFLTGSIKLTPFEYIEQNFEPELLDFAHVKGQEEAKRALEIAAAGGHNLLMSGPPGSGKSMLAKRLPSILPPLTKQQSLETTKIYSVCGMLDKNSGLISKRPFRNPHHTVSAAAIAGGGLHARPGEISLAHNGVLFLDEFPEFRRDVLEALRAPIEDKTVTISRVGYNQTYPSNIMLIAAMNPCPCGYYGHDVKPCTCLASKREAYKNKISGPMLDRIDIHVNLSSVEYDELIENSEHQETSADILKRVLKARDIQQLRFDALNMDIDNNANIPPKLIPVICTTTTEAQQILRKAFESMGLSARSYDKILKVARTIADLESSEHIDKYHILEAIQYRNMDRTF